MAFKLGDSDEADLSDINVTPLVDVMLVLLIIFMITAPMLHRGIDVVLPEADAANLPSREDDPLVLTIREDGLVYLEDDPVHPSQLNERLVPLLEARGERFVYVRGDQQVPYGQVVEVLDTLRRGGVADVGMVTELPRERGGD